MATAATTHTVGKGSSAMVKMIVFEPTLYRDDNNNARCLKLETAVRCTNQPTYRGCISFVMRQKARAVRVKQKRKKGNELTIFP
jgi:hypothetical protein